MNEYSFINNNKPLLPLYWLAIRLTSVNAYIYEFLDKSFEKIYTEKERMWKMLLKSRKESENLLLYRSLFLRMRLCEKDATHYQHLEKGYAGELLFDEYVSTLTNEFLLLNDVLLDFGNNLFQMDSLAIFQESVLLFEVKNFEGDFFVRGDRWYASSDKEIKNPLEQLQRSEALLRRFLQEHGCTLPIEPLLVFVNPEFTLYQAPIKTPIIHPTQIQRLLRTLAIKPTKTTHLHEKIANKLLTHHLSKSPIIRKPDYSYEMLQKGIYCSHCYTFFKEATETRLVCTCGTIESIDDAIVRNVHEFMLLFPYEIVTTNVIYVWCGGVVKSRKTVRRVLSQNFMKKGYKQKTYFTLDI